jgi:predicted nucleic acid-binding protein
MMVKLRAVVDTNVLFEGLTQKGSACGLVIDAWEAGVYHAYVSDALCYEYLDVLTRKLSPQRWVMIEPLLEKLLTQAIFCRQFYSWRPISPDAGDDHLVNCAMNSAASIVTWNNRDFRTAQFELGIKVVTPIQFLAEIDAS